MFFIKVKNYPTLVKLHWEQKDPKKYAHKSIISIAPKVEFDSPKRRIL
jgi:hypothetical protein